MRPTLPRAIVAIFTTAVGIALCLALAALATPPTTATIVEGVLMGKVRLLMKKPAVLAAFGKPASCLVLFTGTEDCQWLAPPGNFVGAVTVRFVSRKAVEIHLMAPDRSIPRYRNVPLLSGWRTTEGIGLGSSTSSVQAAYGHSLKRFTYGAGVDLRLIAKRGGRRIETWFRFSNSFRGVREIVILTPAG